MSESNINKTSWRTVIAMVLLPLMVFGVFLGLATSKSAPKGAIVNNDKSAMVAGESMKLGDEVAKGMIDDPNIAWEVVDADTAERGLKDGTYAASVTIPKDFTANASSFTSNKANQVHNAKLMIDVSENTTLADGLIAQIVNSVATDSVNEALTTGYVDGVMDGFNQVGDSFVQIVDGARQIELGSAELAAGAYEASSGAGELVDGMRQLSDGGHELYSGTNELSFGAKQLSDGAGQLSAGTGELSAGANELGAGASQVNSGANDLAAGASSLDAGAQQVAGGAGELAAGTTELKAGSAGLAVGAAQLASGIPDLYAGATTLKDGIAQYTAGVSQAQPGADQLAAGLSQLSSTMTVLADPKTDPATAPMSDFVAGFQASGIDQQVAAVCTQLGNPAGCEQAVMQIATGSFVGGVQAVAGATAPDIQKMSSGMTQLQAGLQQLVANNDALNTGATQLEQGVVQVQGYANELAAGAGQLDAGVQQVDAGAQSLAAGASELAGGTAQVSSGAVELAAGTSQLAGGAGQLLSGVSQLNSGAQEVTAGASELATGARQLNAGAGELSAGIDEARSGAGELNDGLKQINDGTVQLNEGSKTFTSELVKGQGDLPKFTKSDRAVLSKAAAVPVVKMDVVQPGTFAMIGILIAGLIWGIAFLAFAGRSVAGAGAAASAGAETGAGTTSGGSWAAGLSRFGAVSVLMGAVLGGIGAFAAEAGGATVVWLILLGAMLGASFLFIMHALVGWLGNIGRAIAFGLLALTLVIGITEGTSPWLRALGKISPLENGSDLIRAVLSGGSIGGLALGAAVFLLIGLGGSFALSWKGKALASPATA
ncbi:putative membrane protein [Arcanobacterium pluranimalium]|uniref:YhgE/Pip domain-containing protein n=1 Tax=Arcanobacterium pluranimalium TaxID=108028 RepID=UPI00195A2450|nr:YhgE/Pip domain-containing protein [Arcanobacterium pluranimalium]MBM7824634.1 putative membrane protein [Arcanobacterium pluranimalium]